MVHIHEKIDFTVVAYIINKNRVLLIDHKESKLWLPIGGHVELDEDPEEALFREIEEECGLKVNVLSEKSLIKQEGFKSLLVPRFMDIHKINEGHRHVGMVYFAISGSDDVKLAEKEHNAFRWFTKADINDSKFNLKENVKFYSLEALKIASNM